MSSRHEVEIKISAQNLSDPAFKSLIADLKDVGTTSQETSTRMQSVGNAAKTGGAGILTMAGNIGSLVTGVWAGTQMLTGFIGTTARVMGGVLNLNAGLEMTTVAFEQLTGSASSANLLMDQLRQMAKETPFEFPELAQSAQLLLAFGDAAEDVTDHLTIIGDTVAAFGGGAAEIDKVTRALGQMTAKGKVQGEEMLQLAEMGINGYKILAEQMGLTTEQVINLGQQGKLVASEAVPMLYEGLQKAFGGGMAKQAETFTGMISNLRDAFNMAAADISKPIFDKAKESLADLVAYTETADFEAQIDAWTVKAGEFADSLGSFVQNEGPALLRMMGDIADKTADMAVFAANLPNSPLAKFLENAFTTGPNQATGNDDLNRLSTLNDQAGVIVDIVAGLDQVEWAWARITGNSERADEIAARYATRWNQSEIKPGTDHFINLSDQTLMVDDASKVYDEAAKMASQYFDTVITGEDAMKGFVEVQGVGTVNMEQFIRAVVGLNPLLAAQALAMQQSSDATQDATSTKAAYMQHVYEENAALADQRDAVTELMRAQQDLETVQSSLSDAYQIGLKIQKDYGSQASEYASQASNIEESMKIIQRKQEEGIELTEQEIFIRDHATDALGRYQGGQEDAALTAGEYAVRNGMVMKAQDELNAALGRGEISQEEYIQKMKDAYAAAGLTYDATANNSTVMGTMSSTIANELVPAILNLIQKLDELNGKHVTATVQTDFITTGDPSFAQTFGYQSGSGYVGIVNGNASGGVIDRPMLSMVGEEAPAHPEFIIPTNPSRRGRAMGLWLDAGRALGVPGFADGGGGRTLAGNTGGAAAGQGAGSIDWSWLFAGLDVEAENYTDRAADAFEGLFNDISALASGDAMKRAKTELDDLLTVRQIAIETGAGAEVVAGLDAQIAAKRSELEAIGSAMGTDIVRGIQSELAQANLADMMNEAWSSAFRDLGGILDGSQAADLQATLDELQTKLKLALVGGAPEEVIKAIKENIAEVQRELKATESIYDAALDAGLVDTSVFRMPLDEISKILPEMRDGGLSMIDELVKGVSDGSANLGGAMGLIQQMIDADTDNLAETVGASAADIQDTLLDLQQSLMKDLAEALAEGSDPEVIKQNLAIVEALLGDVSLQVKETSGELRNLVSGQLIKPPSGMGSSSSSGGFNATDVRNGTVRIGNTINLTMADGNQVAQWYADQQYRDEQLAPVGIGG